MSLSNTKFFAFIFLLLCATILSAQICTGNLGDNIFEEGDFGEGTSNILLQDPKIAPGYQYNTSPPPSDGLYTITNNTGQWSNLYGTWMELGDNSSDPNGYMMVVNASFEEGNFYEQTIDGLCENTLYVFSADIINIVKQNITGHHPPNVSFLIDEEVKYSTGDVGQNERWNTYGFTFTTTPNQTSLKLTLRNNAPGGIGNDLALDNITFRPCGPEALILPKDIANICEDGEPIVLEATILGDQYSTPAYQWQRSFDEGETWEDILGETGSTTPHTELASGFYYYRYLLANDPSNLSNSKCRVNSNIKIVRVVPKFYSITDTLCEGLQFLLGNSIYSETGIYTDSLLSSLGCDSIVTLDLTIVPDQNITAEVDVQPPSCFRYQDGKIAVFNIQNAYSPFLISLQNEVADSIGTFRNLGSASYTAKVGDYFGCTFEIDIQLPDPELFEVELGENLKIDLGDGIILSVNSNYDVAALEWSPKDAVLCPTNCLDEEWFPKRSNIYVIDAISEAGCLASDSIRVQIIPVRKVYIPNVFSTRGDGENTHFTIFGAEPNVQRILRLQVFDRWGNLMYEQSDFAPNDKAQGWDGSAQGKNLPTGIYAYAAEILFFDGVVEVFSGDVLLLGGE